MTPPQRRVFSKITRPTPTKDYQKKRGTQASIVVLEHKKRRKIIRNKDDIDSEEEENSQFRVVINKEALIIDEISNGIRERGGLSHPKIKKYSNMRKEDQDKLEEAIIDMIIKFKWVPVEFSHSLPQELYDKFLVRWTYALNIEKKMRERSLIIAMPNLSILEIEDAMKTYANKF